MANRPTKRDYEGDGVGSDYKIASCKMVGLWNRVSFDINFDRNVNFLVGENGTAKTTVISFLNSCLTGDVSYLPRVPFEKFFVFLESANESPPVVISMENHVETDAVIFSVSGPANSGIQREVVVRRSAAPSPSMAPSYSGNIVLDARDPSSASAIKRIRSLTKTIWLPIQRSNPASSAVSSLNPSPVDRRLEVIEKSFAEYVTELLSKTKTESEGFQKKVFLSLLEGRDLRSISKLQNTDIDMMVFQLREVFRQLKIPSLEYTGPLRRFRERLLDALSKGKEKKKGRITLAAEANFLSLLQVSDVLEKWKDYQTLSISLFAELDKVINVFDGYMTPKKMSFTASGNVVFYTIPVGNTNRTRRIAPENLSSGEKQLFIFLMEAFLQGQNNIIYLADEPELSLHIKWQEKLVNSIVSINPHVQLIFATHSPDIVGSYQENIIDMAEKVNSAESID